MRKLVGVFGLFILFFAVGYGYLRSTTELAQINRDPAAVRSNFDFSHLSGQNLQDAAKQRLLAGFELKKTPEGTGIGFGHFVFQDAKGEKKLACQEFGKISMTFIAEGVSVSGDRPIMELEGRCEFSADMSKISPLYIPVAKILNEKAGDGEFRFNEGRVVTVKFVNLSDEWPHTWLLKSMKLSSEKSNAAVVIESNEVAKYLGHPLVINF